MYLPQELKNISNLYRLYVGHCDDKNKEAVGEPVFRTIFNQYNISFHTPKKGKCIMCMKAQNNEEMNETNKENLKIHLREKKASYKRFIVHQRLKTLNNDTVTTSFDLQKVLNTPHGESMLLF